MAPQPSQPLESETLCMSPTLIENDSESAENTTIPLEPDYNAVLNP